MELDRKEVEESMPPGTIAAKFCADCRTTKTPLWRSGPTGPKSLCNACGIRHRKRRALNRITKSTTSSSPSTSTETSTDVVGLKKEEGDKVMKKGEKNSSKSNKKRAKVKNGIKHEKLSVEWRQRLMAFGEGAVLFQKQRSQLKKKQRIDGEKRWGEVEEAAVLLMSLSYGSVLA